jgi:hypothetical protein
LPSPLFDRIELVGDPLPMARCSTQTGGGSTAADNGTSSIRLAVKKGAACDRPADIRSATTPAWLHPRPWAWVETAKAGKCGTPPFARAYGGGAGSRPTRIVISNVWIEANQAHPDLSRARVTHTLVADCIITGRSSSVALNLDAESARNIVRGNVFAARTDAKPSPSTARPKTGS